MNEWEEFVDEELQSGLNKPGVGETIGGANLTKIIKMFYVCYLQKTSADVRCGPYETVLKIDNEEGINF